MLRHKLKCACVKLQSQLSEGWQRVCTWRDWEAMLAEENPLWSLWPSPVPQNGAARAPLRGTWFMGSFPLWEKLHVNSMLEPALWQHDLYSPEQGKGRAAQPQGQMLAGQVGTVEKPPPTSWVPQLAPQPLTRTGATILHLSPLLLALAFAFTVLHNQNDLNLNLPPSPLHGAGARSSQDSGCWANAKSGAWNKDGEHCLPWRFNSRKARGGKSDPEYL